MTDFRNLKVWEKSHKLIIEIYKITALFPIEEKFGLTSQIRRASTSIALNITEGANRSISKEFSRFLDISIGSSTETEYLLFLCHELSYINSKDYDISSQKVIEIRKMLISLKKSLFIKKTRASLPNSHNS